MYTRALRLGTALVLVGVLGAPAAALARDYVASAQAALKKGDLNTAEIELRNAVRQDPQNAALRYDLAEIELRLGDPVAAERDARAAADRGFDAVKARVLLGQALLAEGRAKDLLNEFKPAGKDPVLDARTDVLRGEAQLQLGDRAGAQASFAEAEKLNPADATAWLADARLAIARGDLAAGKDRIEHALKAEPKLMDALVLKAAVLASSGDRAGALGILNQVIAEQPPAIAARVERANILIGEGKRDEAQKDIDAVLALTPGNVQALYLNAVLLHQQKKDKEAEAVLQKLQPVIDSLPRAWLLMAAVQEANGELQQAVESAAKFVARDPKDISGYKLLAQLQLKQGRPDLAVQPLQQAIQTGSADAATYQMLGSVELALKRPDLAASAFAKLRDLAPDNTQVLVESALALQGAGKNGEAVQLLQQAFKKAPQSTQIQELLVSTALASGDVKAAQSALDQVKAVAGETPVMDNLTGLVQLAQLDATGAAQSFRKAVQANPDLTIARVNLARALALEGKGKDAEAELQAVLTAHPASEPALSLMIANAERKKDMAQVLSLLEKAHAAEPKDADLAVRLGTAYLQAGQPAKALDLAKAALGTDGNNVKLMALEADAQVALKNFDDARATFTTLLRQDPRAVAQRRQFAGMLLEHGDYEAARNVIKDGLTATPTVYQLYLDYAMIDLKASGLPAALNTAETLRQGDLAFAPLAALKGDVYMQAGKPAEAVAAYEQAFKTAPSALLVMRLAQAELAQKAPDKARAVLVNWVATTPTDYAALAALSEIDITEGHLKEAEAELKTLTAAQPDNAALINNLAWVYDQLGDPQALPTAERAYRLSPTPQTADTLGWILTQKGQAAKGVALLRQAIATGDARIAYHLAVALKDTGKKEEAMRLLDAVAKAKGDFAEKKDAQKLLGEMTKGS